MKLCNFKYLKNKALVLSVIMLASSPAFAATVNSSSSGNWNDGTKWSTGTQPASGDIVNVNHVMNLNTNLSPSASSTITFLSGSSGSSGTANINMSAGVIDVKANVTFSSTHNLNGGTIYVRNGATLTMGSISLGGTTIIVETGGTLVINGNVTNNGSTIQIDGTVTVTGSYSGANSSANVTGTGSFTTGSSMTSMNGGAIFGTVNGSCAGSCNGNSLCGRTATASPSSSSVCSGSSVTLTGNISSGTPTYQWESSTNSDGGFTNIPGATSSTYSASPIVTSYYRVKITVSTCITKSNVAAINVNASPTITTTTPGSRCGTGTVTLGATASAGTINWYAASSGGASLGTGTSFTTPSVSTTTTFYTDATNNGCTSARTAVIATMNALPAPTISSGSATTFCSGCSVTLTSSSGNTYSWSTGATSSSIVVNTTGSYSVTITDINGCQGTSLATSVTVNNCTSHTWTGNTSSSWSTGSNWNKCAAPGMTDDVTIPNVATAPIISSTSNCRNLTINTSAGLTINSGNTLNIYGNITNNGTYTDNGTTALTGSGAQTSTGIISFNNLTLNNAAGATLNNVTTVNGILTLTSGTLVSGGNLTVNLNTGAIAGTGTGAISGNITIQKTVNSAKYHYIASPLSGLTANDWNDDIAIKSGNYANLYSYDETNTDTNITTGWTTQTSLATPLTSMEGFALYFYGSTSLDETGAYTHSASYTSPALTNTVSNVNGTPKPASDGWNLIGNPYPSTIDWNAASGWTKTGLDNAIYFLDPVNDRYASYVSGSGTNGGTQYIPAMQAFWIKVTSPGTGSLAMSNTVRVTSTNPSIWRTGSVSDILKLSASSGGYIDETIIRFREDAIEQFDSQLDAYKINNKNNTPSLYTEINNNQYSVNSLPYSYKNMAIPVKLAANFTGVYNFTAEEIGSFSGDSIIFEDKLLGVRQDLRSNPSYICSIAKGDTSARFYISFRQGNVRGLNLNPPASPFIVIRSTEENINIQFLNDNSNKASIGVYNVLGEQVFKVEDADISAKEYSIKPSAVTNGIYIVKVVTDLQTSSRKVYLMK